MVKVTVSGVRPGLHMEKFQKILKIIANMT